MELPSKTDLPFFAYGIFKPKQLGFFRIKELTKNFDKGEVEGILKERDGLPLLIKSSDFQIKGYLIYFYDSREKEAYHHIIEIEPDEVYRWDEIKVNIKENESITANVLLGKREQRGSSDLEYCGEWNGKEDPFFKDGLKEIEEILRKNAYFNGNYRSLFRLQMAYTLLWSAIERYAGLRYHLGKKVNEKVFRIAEEKCFIDSLKRNVVSTRKVFSATDLEKYTLDPNDPGQSIRYYYQVRSNVVHRGKAVTRDFGTVKLSLKELLAIFRDLLNEAFK
jgi:hypothetical protein